MTQNIMLFLSVCLMTLLFAGFRGWDCEATGVDINDELAQIANRAALGEEGPNGQYSLSLVLLLLHVYFVLHFKVSGCIAVHLTSPCVGLLDLVFGSGGVDN